MASGDEMERISRRVMEEKGEEGYGRKGRGG
jgi:hypothetical protein